MAAQVILGQRPPRRLKAGRRGAAAVRQAGRVAMPLSPVIPGERSVASGWFTSTPRGQRCRSRPRPGATSTSSVLATSDRIAAATIWPIYSHLH